MLDEELGEAVGQQNTPLIDLNLLHLIHFIYVLLIQITNVLTRFRKIKSPSLDFLDKI